MDRDHKLELVKRSLAIRHKLKVHESMEAPDTHDELAKILLSKWELEDELKAIEELITEFRTSNVAHKKAVFENAELKVAIPMPLFSRDGKHHHTEKQEVF